MTMLRPALPLAAILVAELAGRSVDPRLGVGLYAVLLVTFLNGAAAAGRSVDRALLLSLTLIPLTRLLAMTLPLGELEPLARYPVVGLAVVLGMAIAIRVIGYRASQLGLTVDRRHIRPTAALLVGGIGLSFLAYPILGPSLPPNRISLVEGPLLAVLLGLSTGLVEELYFRGLLQLTSVRRLGQTQGILYVSVLFAAVSVDRWSVGGLAMAFAVAIVLAIVTVQTGSIIPAAVGHGAFNIMLLMVVPFAWSGAVAPG